MLNNWQKLVAACSTVLRASTFIFLRWIPGHHFPPLIISALVLYLATIYAKSEAFGSTRILLQHAFPAVFKQEKIEILDSSHEHAIEFADIEHDDPVIYEDEYPFFKTLIWGIPDWSEREFTYTTVMVNILLTILSLDLVLRGPILYPSNDLRFSRVGFVDEHSAKILFREPMESQFPIYAYVKQSNASEWNTAMTYFSTGSETDYTAPLTIGRLLPDTAYMYWLSNNLTGSFRTAPAPGTLQAQSLTFLSSSCIKANFPYNPFSHALSIHGFEHLSKLVRTLPTLPAFMLFLGDFIYVDVPQRLSSTFSHYRAEYRRVYASPSWKLRGLDAVPWLHTLDDHEIANDWSGGNQTAPFPAASDPFIHYHVSVNPPVPPSSPPVSETNTTYFQFTRGPASFFMLDTRRYRTDPEPPPSAGVPDSTMLSSGSSSKPLYGSSQFQPNNPPSPEEYPASMLGKTQLEALLRYLRTPEPAGVHWKFIASSVPFTKNWRFGTSDTWGGFLHERSQILAAMHTAEATLGIRVIILSGDRHEFAAVRFPPAILHLEDNTPNSAQTERMVDIDLPTKNIHNDKITDPKTSTTTIYDHTPQSGPHEFSVGPLSMFYLPIRTFNQMDTQDVTIKYLPDGNSKVGVVSIKNLVSNSDLLLKKSWGWNWGLFGASTANARNVNGNGNRNEGRQLSVLTYALWIDGRVAWEYTLTSPGPSYRS